MTGFGPPSSPPSGAPARPAGGGLGLPAILAYAAGGLGVLDFIWGFLDFYGPSEGSGNGLSGYTTGAAGILALTVLAGLIAAGEAFEGKQTSLLAVGAAVGGLLVTFGSLVDVPDGASASIGLILAIITSVLQAGVLVYLWLIATGKISAPQPKPQGPPQGYGPQGYGPQGGSQGYGGPQGAPQGYGGQQGAPQGPPQGPPPGYGAPQGPPPGGGYGTPGTYGQPQGGQPQGGQQGGPSGPPQGPPGQNPPPPPQGNPYSPPQGGQH